MRRMFGCHPGGVVCDQGVDANGQNRAARNQLEVLGRVCCVFLWCSNGACDESGILKGPL